MKIDKLVLGDFKTNCYVVSHNSHAFIIDPATSGPSINNFIKEKGYNLEAILLTHGHQDHIGAVDYLYSVYGCKIIAHINDQELVEGTNELKMAPWPSQPIKVTSPVTYLQSDFESLTIGGVVVDAILTPGHTKGSVTYVLRNYYRIFSGDCVFKGSVGRVDLPTGSEEELMASLEVYKDFKDICKVHPGHGENTTIADEKKNNPYFKD